jgi:hypothetical protein
MIVEFALGMLLGVIVLSALAVVPPLLLSVAVLRIVVLIVAPVAGAFRR